MRFFCIRHPLAGEALKLSRRFGLRDSACGWSFVSPRLRTVNCRIINSRLSGIKPHFKSTSTKWMAERADKNNAEKSRNELNEKLFLALIRPSGRKKIPAESAFLRAAMTTL